MVQPHINSILVDCGTTTHINSILVDCGATTHIINDDSQFVYTDKSYIPEEHFIELADRSRTNNIAKKRGIVVVDIQDKYGIIRKATLNNALYSVVG